MSTIKQLEQKIVELEQRIKVLENTRPIIYPQPFQNYPLPGGTQPRYPNYPACPPNHPNINWC